jgi:hypothetical protein
VLTRVDRIQVATVDARPVVRAWQRLLDAGRVREDRVAPLTAKRSVLRAGSSEVEVLEPDGVGPLANWLGRTGGGLFAGGFATPDPEAMAAHLRGQGLAFDTAGEQIFLGPAALGVPGLRVVISREEERTPAGLLRALYEVTSLVEDWEAAASRIATLFALDPAHFQAIHSDQFGYTGALTLFRPDALDRIEAITPFDGSRTMGRYFRRKGPRLYMAYAEAHDTAYLRDRLLELAPGGWTGPSQGLPDNLYIHPAVLGGVMLGVSRPSFAWSWSGHPERVLA